MDIDDIDHTVASLLMARTVVTVVVPRPCSCGFTIWATGSRGSGARGSAALPSAAVWSTRQGGDTWATITPMVVVAGGRWLTPDQGEERAQTERPPQPHLAEHDGRGIVDVVLL